MRPRISTEYVLLIVVGTLLLASCSNRSREPTTGVDPTNRIVSSTPPFQTREPDRYRAVRTIIFTDAAGKSVITKTTIARYQALRREETETESTRHLVFLDSDQGRVVVLPEAKIYAEINGSVTNGDWTDSRDFDSSPERLLHSEALLSSYEKLGSESISGRNATKYRVTVNTSPGGNVSSTETVIWIDEGVGMPIKSESKANDGSRTLMELSDLELDVDMNLFRIPAGYEKVTAAELQRRLMKN